MTPAQQRARELAAAKAAQRAAEAAHLARVADLPQRIADLTAARIALAERRAAYVGPAEWEADVRHSQ